MSILRDCLRTFVTNFVASITIDFIAASASCIEMVTFVTKVKSAAVIVTIAKVVIVPMVTR